MATVAQTKLLTAEEFMAADLGEGAFELVRGGGNRAGEISTKIAEYQAVGTLLVWVVYPKSRSVVIHRLDDEPPLVLRDDAVIENLPELPGLRCPVADLFA